MKTFVQFIIEARTTAASTEAKNRGLKSDAHGDYYDNQGNLVAKTVGGKLQYFGQGGAGAQQQQQTQQKTSQAAAQQTAPQQTQTAPQKEQQEPNGAVIVLGRFNPPSKNHEALLKAGYSQATRRDFEYRIYPSRIQDDATNPLNVRLKVSYMQSMYPQYADYIVDSDKMKTIFDVLESLYGDGYTDIVIVVGQDRLGEFQSLAHKGEGESYQFNSIQVISAGVKDPDSEAEGAGSSAMMRTAAAMGDYEKFSSGLPATMKIKERKEMFNTIKRSMKVNENTELWKIAPELDYNGMRWNYKKNGLFEVGALVENLNTGLVGRILRKGSNHLICVTEDGVMFKSWLRDLREVQEIGTCDYRAHAQSVTPGQPVVSYTDTEVKITMPKKKINTKRNSGSK